MSEFIVPTHWTVEQADLVLEVLHQVSQAIQEAYEDHLFALWHERGEAHYEGTAASDAANRSLPLKEEIPF